MSVVSVPGSNPKLLTIVALWSVDWIETRDIVECPFKINHWFLFITEFSIVSLLLCRLFTFPDTIFWVYSLTLTQ